MAFLIVPSSSLFSSVGRTTVARWIPRTVKSQTTTTTTATVMSSGNSFFTTRTTTEFSQFFHSTCRSLSAMTPPQPLWPNSLHRQTFSNSFKSTSRSSSSPPTTMTIRTTTTTPINTSGAGADEVTDPTSRQKYLVFAHAAVPMIGFGFIDQTIMIWAADVIDCTLGVTFGLSTLTAAAVGSLVSNSCGVMFGNSMEVIFKEAGVLPRTYLTTSQRRLPVIKKIQFAASVVGIVIGGLFGLLNLLLIDTQKSSTLKLQEAYASDEIGGWDSNGSAFSNYTIEVSNATKDNVTSFKVNGPDRDGLLASLTGALSAQGANILEIRASPVIINKRDDEKQENNHHHHREGMVEDVFHVVDKTTGNAFEDDQLQDLAQGLLDATRTTMSVQHVQAAMREREHENLQLRARVERLEQVIAQKQITVVTSTS